MYCVHALSVQLNVYIQAISVHSTYNSISSNPKTSFLRLDALPAFRLTSAKKQVCPEAVLAQQHSVILGTKILFIKKQTWGSRD